MKPLFKPEYVVDVEVTSDFYLSLSRKIIDVYWNSKKHHLPEEYRQGSSLVITGTEVMAVKNLNKSLLLYVVASNNLIRY